MGFFLGVLVFIRSQPFYFWPYEDTIRPICAILILGICVTNLSKEKWSKWVFLCLSIAYRWAVLVVDHSGIVTLFNFVAFAFIPVIRKDLVFSTYSVYRRLLIIVLALSLINYLLVLTGVVSTSTTIDPLNSAKSYNYYRYPFLVQSNVINFVRFHGVFDEPGVVGTICGMILIAERMAFRRIGNIVLLIAGLFSLSFYFYVALFFGLVLFSSGLKHRWSILLLFAIIAFVSYKNDFMYDQIWHRFEWDAEASAFVGDNRSSDSLDAYYDSIKWTLPFFVGSGTAIAKEYIASASLKLIVIKHGLVFVLLNILGYILLSSKVIKNKIDLVAFLIFFFLTLYQRPGFYNTASIFLYTMAIYTFGESNRLQKD